MLCKQHAEQGSAGAIAAWTVGVLSAGSVVGALFSLPFWFAGDPPGRMRLQAHQGCSPFAGSSLCQL